jgi:DNA-binding CsgD family transcriptional regulator
VANATALLRASPHDPVIAPASPELGNPAGADTEDCKDATMSTTLPELDYARRTAERFLDNIARPALLLTFNCTVVHMNDRAQQAVACKRGLMTTPAGRLVLQEREETIKLHELVAKAVVNGAPHNDFLIFSVPEELSPNSMLIHPLALTSERPLPGQMPEPARQVLITVHYRQDSHLIPEERVRAAFGLTYSESQVVLGLAAGITVSLLARETNRSVHTVRLHLKRAMSKAHCHSQSELLNVLFRTIGQPI